MAARLFLGNLLRLRGFPLLGVEGVYFSGVFWRFFSGNGEGGRLLGCVKRKKGERGKWVGSGRNVGLVILFKGIRS